MKKIVLITGGTSGIGLEFAKIFSQEGYDLCIIARNKAKLETTSKILLESNPSLSVYTLSVDLSRENSVDLILSFLKRNSLFVDVLINNAGFALHGGFYEHDWDSENGLLFVNVVNLLKLTRFLLPGMIEKKHGYILNVSSIAAFQPGPHMSTYYASKAFIYSWSLALSEEVRKYGVFVTALCPGPTKTNFPRRAGVSDTIPFRFFSLMTASQVAKAGYNGMIRKKRVVVPGLFNYIQWKIIRFVPLELLLRFVGRLH